MEVIGDYQATKKAISIYIRNNMQKQMLLDISDLLDKYNVKHCLMFGTLLGAIRENNFLEWDNEDIDLGIFEQFWKPNDLLWRNFNLDLRNSGYYVKDMAYNYICIASKNNPNLHIDLYLLLKTPEEYQVIVTGIIAHFPFEDFDTLDTISFMGKIFNIPHNVETHLVHNYGPNWRTPSTEIGMYSRTPVNNYNKITYTYIISEYL